MTPEHLVNSAKLYDYYVNGFNDGHSSHTARVHLSTIDLSTTNTPATFSAPSLMDLVNAKNVDPKDIDTAQWEEYLFNHPDPYDLDEVDRVDKVLQAPPVVRSSQRFDISDYVKLSDSKLRSLITNVDIQGPGAAAVDATKSQDTAVIGTPGEWSIDSFLSEL